MRGLAVLGVALVCFATAAQVEDSGESADLQDLGDGEQQPAVHVSSWPIPALSTHTPGRSQFHLLTLDCRLAQTAHSFRMRQLIKTQWLQQKPQRRTAGSSTHMRDQQLTLCWLAAWRQSAA